MHGAAGLALWFGHAPGTAILAVAPMSHIAGLANSANCAILAGETLVPRPGIRLVTAPLNHPNGATGYRVEYAGKSVCYVTDTEHRKEGRDPVVLELVRGADILICDSTYTDAEYPKFVGWGHSTWQEGVRIADAAGVGQLVLFHHDPTHDDEVMAQIEAAAAAARTGTVAAREGLVLEA